MSSHHIVRDEQEPALILHRLGDFPESTLQSLLEWSPTVLCCQPVIEQFTSMGYKLDVALVNLIHHDRYKEHLSHQFPVKILTSSNNDFLNTALDTLDRDQHSAVNVVTDDKSSPEVIQLLDQWMAKLDMVVLTETERMLIVKTKTFRKWVAKGTSIGLQSLRGESRWVTKGFDHDISDLEAYDHQLSKTEEGEVSIHCQHPPYLIIEEL